MDVVRFRCRGFSVVAPKSGGSMASKLFDRSLLVILG
jgi:hypothetical protein